MDKTIFIGYMKVRIKTQRTRTPRRERRSKQTCVIYARFSGYDTMSACDF